MGDLGLDFLLSLLLGGILTSRLGRLESTSSIKGLFLGRSHVIQSHGMELGAIMSG